MSADSVDAARTFGAAYDRRADGYAAFVAPGFAPVHRRIVQLARLAPGMRVLDLATGTGGVAREAGAAGARVTGLDASAGMLEIARQTSPREIEFLLGDAGHLPFPGGAFDLALCGFGISHMPHSAVVLAEVLRVVRSGGSFIASAWGQEAVDPSKGAVQRVLEAYLPGWEHPLRPIMNEDLWSDPASGEQEFRRAGFQSVTVVTEKLAGVYASPLEALNRSLAGPIRGEMADAIPKERRARFRAEALAAVEAAGDLTWSESVNYYAGVVPDATSRSTRSGGTSSPV